MECFVDRDSLITAIRQLQGACGELTGVQSILGHLKLAADKHGLKAVAGNTIVSATTMMPAEVRLPGDVCVPLRQFRDAIEFLPPGKVFLQLGDGNRLTISAGRWLLTVVGRHAGDYPSVPVAPLDSVSIPGEALRFLLKRTAHAASKDLQNPKLASVHIAWQKPYLVSFATDGGRASQAKIRCEARGLRQIFLHQLATSEILRVISLKMPEFVYVSESDNHTFIGANETVMVINQLAGQASERPQEMFSEAIRSARVMRRELLEALRASKKMTQQPPVWLSLSADGIVVSSDRRIQVASAEIRVLGKVWGELIKVCANGEHLIEGLEALDSDEVDIGFGETTRDAILVRPREKEEVSMIFMPMIYNV